MEQPTAVTTVPERCPGSLSKVLAATSPHRGPHPIYAALIARAKAEKNDTYVVIMHALRYILKERQYYVNVTNYHWEKPKIMNVWTGKEIPDYGLSLYGNNNEPNIRSLLGLDNHGMALVKQAIISINIYNEVYVFRQGQRNIYYHLYENSSIDRAWFPAFEVMIEFSCSRDHMSKNPYAEKRNTQKGRKRPRTENDEKTVKVTETHYHHPVVPASPLPSEMTELFDTFGTVFIPTTADDEVMTPQSAGNCFDPTLPEYADFLASIPEIPGF